MASFTTPYVASNMPSFDSQYATPESAAMRNNLNQRQLYLGSTSNGSPPTRTGTQRVSKAMKGKRVHACERPGCSKVFTRAEHRRRHELSHEPKKQYHCTYEGCKKAFHRPDYLTQHLGRHASSAGKEDTSRAQQDTLSPGPSPQQRPLSQPVIAPPLALNADTTHSYPGMWGNMDPSMPYSHYPRGQSQSSASIDDHPSPYSYTNEICHSPVANDSFTNPQYPVSGMPAEMVTAIDQYLRSILKPEAFSTTQQAMNPNIWSSDLDIDPTLTKIETPDQLPLYSWPPAHHIQYDHPTQMNHPPTDH